MKLQACCWIMAFACMSGVYGDPNASDEPVTEGALLAQTADGQELGFCPLKHTDVAAEIAGFIGRVTVTQRFANPFEEPIEAVYCFPLSDKAAVDSMEMKIGDRTIRGVIKERAEARRIYEQARAAGQRAALLDQERANIFTQSISNLMPGDEIDITISYVEYLPYEDDVYTFSFPMVVGPRYIPGTPQAAGTDQVPDASRIAPPVTPKGTRAGHDISLTVALDAGAPLQELRSILHEVDTNRTGADGANVTLKNQHEIPNRDFVLTYKVAQENIQDAVLVHHDSRGGFFSLVLYPPARVTPEQATPKEMIFVIDCSGSMSGFPIEKAKETMRLAIEAMNPNDTFNLISFAGGQGYCFPSPLPNTPQNRAQALEYLAALEGGGGTEMMGAVRAALKGPYAEDRLRVVCFMTDGFIGNDMEILGEIRRTAADARVFSFGIGNSVNRFLIEGMAREGRGASEIVTLESEGADAAMRFHERIHSPVLTDIRVDFGGLPVEELYPDPAALPDLFSATPVTVTGRYTEAASGTITLQGRTAEGPFERVVDVTLPENAEAHEVLAPLWARAKIDALTAQDWSGMQAGNPEKRMKQEVIALGIEYSLLTPFTSFVAVEERFVNQNGRQVRVEVPVEMPDGVSYEGVFGDAAGAMVGMAKSGNALAVTAMGEAAPPSIAHHGGRRTAPSSADFKTDADQSSVQLLLGEEKEETRTEAPQLEKLDPVLQSLLADVEAGRPLPSDVNVIDGKLEVLIEVSKIEESQQDIFRNLNVEVVSAKHSGNVYWVNAPIDTLKVLSTLPWILKITLP